MRQLLGIVQLVAAIALMALAGQALLHVAAGRDRERNAFYRVLRAIPSPLVRLTRLVTPRFVEDRLVPFAAFCWLAALFVWLAFAIPRVGR